MLEAANNMISKLLHVVDGKVCVFMAGTFKENYKIIDIGGLSLSMKPKFFPMGENLNL